MGPFQSNWFHYNNHQPTWPLLISFFIFFDKPKCSVSWFIGLCCLWCCCLSAFLGKAFPFSSYENIYMALGCFSFLKYLYGFLGCAGESHLGSLLGEVCPCLAILLLKYYTLLWPLCVHMSAPTLIGHGPLTHVTMAHKVITFCTRMNLSLSLPYRFSGPYTTLESLCSWFAKHDNEGFNVGCGPGGPHQA